MSLNNDTLISCLTVRLRKENSDQVIGSGLICYQENFKDKVYIITAAHCLFEDSTKFNDRYLSIIIDIYNPQKDTYESVIENIDERLINKDLDRDIGIVVIEKSKVEQITGEIPVLKAVQERQLFQNFIIKGFPNATQGKELDVIFPTWKQQMTEAPKFQLQLNEDYVEWATEGFSGSGIFLKTHQDIFLFGIFTRFRPEEKGRVIYCQYIHTVNEILSKNFLPLISFTYLGQNGLTTDYFKRHISKSIENSGPRFNEKLNLKLPISKLFSDLAKDDYFRKRFITVFDKWLYENRYFRNQENAHLKDIETELQDIVNNLKTWINQLNFDVETKIDTDWVESKINNIQGKIDEKINHLHNLRYEEFKDKKDKEYSRHLRPYEQEINRLYEIMSRNNRMLSNLGEINLYLSNNPMLLIKGEAGSGKSHLLGDIAFERQKLNLPSFLLLGQHFKTSVSIENNIIKLLGLDCSFEELLESANSIGKQIGSRFLILIDALNEGAGARLWKNEIAGFISQVAQYPYVGLAMSVRTTYFSAIVPENMRQGTKKLAVVNHEGFKGNEYAALNMFCKHYQLKQPNFPILSPEFTTPLFLILICEGVKNSPDKSFPQGFQGISKVFKYYIKAIEEKLIERRQIYASRPKLIQEAINKFSQRSFDNDARTLKLEETEKLFNKEFPQFTYLLNDLIQESVFIKSIRNNYKTGEDEEIVYFAYERFGDFFTVNRLLDTYSSSKKLKRAFKRDNRLRGLVNNEIYYGKSRGILEALAILLPEKFSLELYEVYPWVFSKNEKFKKFRKKCKWLSRQMKKIGLKPKKNEPENLQTIRSSISDFVQSSLTWRSVESVNIEKLGGWFTNQHVSVDYLFISTELAVTKNHPLNGDMLHKMLLRHTMPERDSFWQRYMRWYSGYNDDDHAFPLRRLIDWAWIPNVSNNIDFETARLTGQTLAWLLSSTNRRLRDQATKAMVNLLEQQPKALISILNAFQNINDKYISERLYAVAYGCILRTTKNGGVKEISQYVYDTIFRYTNPPEHILLRDYARNAIEYAVHKKVGINVNLELIRPPYKSKLPELPTEADVNKYNIDYKSPEYDKNYGGIFNQIHHSVMTWDFGRYVIESALRNFSPINFNLEKVHTAYFKNLDEEKSMLVNLLLKLKMQRDSMVHKKRQLTHSLGAEKYERHLLDCESFISKIVGNLEDVFKDESHYVKQELVPFLKNKQTLDNERYHRRLFDITPVKCWIVQRAFELGYDISLHGDHDKNHSNYNSRNDNTERIGKKYQWIAFHEIMSIITDNYKIKNSWGEENKYEYCEGAWQISLRNIDPAYTKYHGHDDEEKTSDQLSLDSKNWWDDDGYRYWNQPNLEWLEKTEDLPAVKHLLLKKDYQEQEWIFLYKSITLWEPKQIGASKYEVENKRILLRAQSFIIRSEQKEEIVAFLKDKDVGRCSLPEQEYVSYQLFNREQFWSPIYNDSPKESEWQNLRDQDENSELLKVLVPLIAAKGGFGSSDQSGASSSYDIVCKSIFEGLNLRYGALDGSLEDIDGNIILMDTPTGTIIKKDIFLDYLEKNNLEIIWCLSGQKTYKLDGGGYHSKAISGVFQLVKGIPEGKINLFDW